MPQGTAYQMDSREHVPSSALFENNKRYQVDLSNPKKKTKKQKKPSVSKNIFLRLCSIRFLVVVPSCPSVVKAWVSWYIRRRSAEYKYQSTVIHKQCVTLFSSKILHFLLLCKMIPWALFPLIFTSTPVSRQGSRGIIKLTTKREIRWKFPRLRASRGTPTQG